MLFIKIIFLLIFPILIFAANNLQSNYFIKNDFIMLSDIIHVNKKDDKKLFNIDKYRHSKRIKRDKLLKILQKNGYSNYASKHSYIQFTKRSPIDTTLIQNSIKKLYTQKYKTINISLITLVPTRYLDKLPKNYSIHFNKRAHLSKKGVLYIKTDDNKKIFFNYQILAAVSVLTARNNIKKDSELSSVNTRKNSIILNKFRAMPLQGLHVSRYQAKHNLKANDIITSRDVIGLYLVKRGSNVNVSLQNAGIDIFFSAKALQNGRLGDSISVMQKNDKKLKVVVVGRNKAEVK
ncbi:flagellar basal body P-ring formation chaperone FlgA [Sulfurimonas autotrophica]|uniref:Flagella basal body P-ring formation protein FlgA n=1 Tax=Sulfurimonas autotrophica (strain ATCC BAA-671 / DSM 16294 / JCM 11897 / OK10) TaxID=563040 RepID=E0USI8_SULAO|nr:flagellar basal body P-ring formation chaperone FlgA [Sulfurimonas autotrophica]ADN09151.1 flagella basal body P-ring formation protein FlgA [Sulfurimonas autotrophica DSM 16294]